MEGLGSALPAMENSRALGVKNLQLGHAQFGFDAETAYLQTWLSSDDAACVHPLREFWPAEWKHKYK